MGGMTRLLLLLWVGVTASTVVDLQKRVIEGSPCKPDQRQYHVKLILSKGGLAFLCGGSLINEQWILTAAHCWERGWTMTAYLGRAPHPVPITTEPEIFEYNGKKHDIMLLELPDGTTIPHKVKSVLLPDCTQRPKTGEEVQIAGHGAPAAGTGGKRLDTTTDILHCAETDIVDTQSNRDCLKIKSPNFYQSREHQHLIFGQRTRVDISLGDSGGGVEYKGMIYGVHSFSSNRTCATAAGFMDVCEYMEWIHETISPPTVGCSWCG